MLNDESGRVNHKLRWPRFNSLSRFSFFFILHHSAFIIHDLLKEFLVLRTLRSACFAGRTILAHRVAAISSLQIGESQVQVSRGKIALQGQRLLAGGIDTRIRPQSQARLHRPRGELLYTLDAEMTWLSVGDKPRKISALVEGRSIRSAELMTGNHRDTITRLLLDVGKRGAWLLNERMRRVGSNLLEADEVWTFVARNEKRLKSGDNHEEMGDQYFFVIFRYT
jgi:hypothetical protein